MLTIAQATGTEQHLKTGILGLDTSHAVAFTKTLNAPDAIGALADVAVVAAYPGGSPDVARSWQTLPEYTQQVRQLGVAICGSIEEVVAQVEVVLLLSRDGRMHLDQARAAILAGKPLFIDKPVAASLVDVVRIYALADKHGVPCFPVQRCDSVPQSPTYRIIRA